MVSCQSDLLTVHMTLVGMSCHGLREERWCQAQEASCATAAEAASVAAQRQEQLEAELQEAASQLQQSIHRGENEDQDHKESQSFLNGS